MRGICLTIALGASLVGCASFDLAMAPDNENADDGEYLLLEDEAVTMSREVEEEPEMAAAPGLAEKRRSVAGGEISVIGGAKGKASEDKDASAGAPDDDAAPSEARTRAWFPETFLWQPVVETGDDGVATVPLRVPDRLTTWRVLGLAHTRAGQQAGAVHTFDSVQDVYVDPVLPDHLHVGDRLELPVQAVNTTGAPRYVALDVTGTAALAGGRTARLRLSGGGTVVQTVSLDARLAGSGVVTASLGELDRVVRDVSVRPVGKPHVGVAGGSLTDVRAFTLDGPDGADPMTQELSVQVYPGGLAVLQAELERLAAGGAVSDPAYGFAVTTRLGQMAAAADVELDDDAVRRVRQRAWQRLVRQAGYDPDPRQLVSLVGALRDVEDHELAVERRDLWARRLVDVQRADGTWAPSDRGTVQSLVVQTATAAWVLPDDEAYDSARAKARGALERLARQVDDPFTASVVVGSGLVDGDLRDTLVQQVLDGIRERTDGSRTVRGPGSVHSALGVATRAEALAWARLALEERDDLPWRDDLVAELMAGYGPSGFGGGAADRVALVAVAESLPSVSSPVEIVLLADDREVARGSLDPAQPRVPLLLAASPRSGDPDYTLKVVGDAPGLAWTARLRSWTPWARPADTGVDASWTPGPLRAGRLGTSTLVVSAPGESVVTARLGVPAGTWVDLDALRRHPAVQQAEHRQDTLEVRLRALKPAEILEIPVTVQPTFAGRFSTGPVSLQVRGPRSLDVDLPPPTWRVAL